MQMRTYALALMAIAFGLFVAVVSTNILINPQYVFATRLLPQPQNLNDRYRQVLEYQAAPQKYDGIIFGSSRAFSIPLDELSQAMDGVHFASFAVVGGTIVDHMAALKFVLRDKAARGERIRAVFLLLDTDAIGQRPLTNESNQFLLPPALSGENPIRFWWKNLITIQFKAWESAIRSARRTWSQQHGAGPTHLLRALLREFGLMIADAQAQPAAPEPRPDEPERVTKRAYYSAQLKLIEQFVALCREHDIRIVVATSPLTAFVFSLFDPADLRTAVRDVSRIVPLWDFTNAGWVASDPALWHDSSHFHREVAEMMLRKIFGREVPPAWSSVGHPLP
jgi:hypothetical protein